MTAIAIILAILIATYIVLKKLGYLPENNEELNEYIDNAETDEQSAQDERGEPRQASKQPSPYEYHYRSKYFLTKNEYYFYKSLKPVADKLGYSVMGKVRMADLVVPTCPKRSRQFKFSFAKIQAKHVDFVLANPYNLRPILLIELDDNSHNNEKRKKRDEFCDAVYKEAGYKILHIRGSANLEEAIKKAIEE